MTEFDDANRSASENICFSHIALAKLLHFHLPYPLSLLIVMEHQHRQHFEFNPSRWRKFAFFVFYFSLFIHRYDFVVFCLLPLSAMFMSKSGGPIWVSGFLQFLKPFVLFSFRIFLFIFFLWGGVICMCIFLPLLWKSQYWGVELGSWY